MMTYAARLPWIYSLIDLAHFSSDNKKNIYRYCIETVAVLVIYKLSVRHSAQTYSYIWDLFDEREFLCY
jgi:hypothetical protein